MQKWLDDLVLGFIMVSKKKKKNEIRGFKVTMAVFDTNYEAKAILLLGIALLSYGMGTAVAFPIHQNGYGGRRGLVAAGPAAVFDVTHYGAKADGKTDNYLAFMQAWVAACHSPAPAKLVIPAGTYLTGPVAFGGPCKSSEPITVEVSGTVKALSDMSAYSSPEWFSFETIDGLVLTGGGTFDAQGPSVWHYNDCRQKSDCHLLPHSIKFNQVNNSVIEGINLLNSMSFHMFIANSEKVTIHNVSITAPGDSPNTDGIHISSSNLVNVTNNVIGTGDDCVSIGQGSTNISVTKINCGPGHGISIGSLGKYDHEDDVNGIVVRNCTFRNTTNGARIKTWGGSPPSQASSIVFEDIIMDGVANPIIIDQNYGSKKKSPSRVKISDVHFRNIKGTTTTNTAVNLMCSTMVPCDAVEFLDIDLTYTGNSLLGKGLAFVSTCLNAKSTFGGKLNPPPCH